jgi:hypothetical protein
MRLRKRGKLKFMAYLLHLVIGRKNSQDIGSPDYVAIPEHLRTFTIFRVKSMLDRICENGGRFPSLCKNRFAEGDLRSTRRKAAFCGSARN